MEVLTMSRQKQFEGNLGTRGEVISGNNNNLYNMDVIVYEIVCDTNIYCRCVLSDFQIAAE